MTSDLDELLDTIAELEDDTEEDTFPWCDAAGWSPSVVERDYLVFEDDGCVMLVDGERPWVVREYQPPWWAV